MSGLMVLRRRVRTFVEKTWGPEVFTSRWERSMRILEEAIELAQAEGIDEATVHKMTTRVFTRPVGEPTQEYQGVGVCWLAGSSRTFCSPEELLEDEIERIENMDPEKLRAKQRDKAAAGLGLPPFGGKVDV